MIHALKTVQPYFDDVAAGIKPFEVRKADRPFAVGDLLALNEWDEENYTGRFVLTYVTYVLDNPEYVKDGYAILGIVLAKVFTNEQLYRRDIMRDKLTNGYEVYERGWNNG